MAYRFEVIPRALAEADLIFDRIAERSPAQAARWYQGLFQQFESLRRFPLRCPVAPESIAYGVEVREALHGKRPSVYRILFAVRGDLITILAVWHAAHGPRELAE